MSKTIGVPVRLLHEAEGQTVTVELKTGEIYRGELIVSEDSMNMKMRNVTMNGRDGKVSSLQHAFIRGASIKFVIIPDILKHSPMFKRLAEGKYGGPGAGKGAVHAMRIEEEQDA